MGPCNYVFSVNHAGLKHDSLIYLVSNKIIFFLLYYARSEYYVHTV